MLQSCHGRQERTRHDCCVSGSETMVDPRKERRGEKKSWHVRSSMHRSLSPWSSHSRRIFVKRLHSPRSSGVGETRMSGEYVSHCCISGPLGADLCCKQRHTSPRCTLYRAARPKCCEISNTCACPPTFWHSSGPEPRAWEIRSEAGKRVATRPAQLVGSTCLPEARSNIRRRK